MAVQGSKNKPNFLVIGSQKAGTSWLWVQLKKHPNIWMPPIKELHFFDYHFAQDTKNWAHGHIQQNVFSALKWNFRDDVGFSKMDYSYVEYLAHIASKDDMFSEAWYEYCFDRPNAQGKALGDITPEYSTISREGVQYVKKYLAPDVKIIYLIRDPVDRAMSQLRMGIERRGINPADLDSNGWTNLPDEEALLVRGDYKKYIPIWDEHFDAEQILYLPYKRIKNKPGMLLRQVETLLGLEPYKGYGNLRERVHVTTKIDIPDYVIQRYQEIFKEQYVFLDERFGAGFL